MPYTEKRGDGDYPWRVRWPIPGKKTPAGAQAYDSASGFADEDAARDYGLDMESDLRRGRYKSPDRGSRLLKDWAQEWRKSRKISPRSRVNLDNDLDNHLLPGLGDCELRELNWWVVQQWGNAQACAASSTNKRIRILGQMLTSAVDANLIDSHAILGRSIADRYEESHETVYTSGNEAYRIAERCLELPDRCRRADGRLRSDAAYDEPFAKMLRMLVYLLDGTGLRIGEALGLHRDNCGQWRRELVDGAPWRTRVLKVDPKRGQWIEHWDRHGEQAAAPYAVAKPGRARRRTAGYFGPPKPPNGSREVDVPGYLWSMLEKYLAWWPHPYLFCRPDGTMYSRYGVDYVLSILADGSPERTGARGYAPMGEWQPIRPGLSAHGLRHGHNTAMIELRTPEILRCDRLGHSVKGLGVQGIYSHPTAEMRRDLVDALEGRHTSLAASLKRPGLDLFPEFSQTINGTPRRKLRAV